MILKYAYNFNVRIMHRKCAVITSAKPFSPKRKLNFNQDKKPSQKQKLEMPLLMVDKSFLCEKCLSGKHSYLLKPKERVCNKNMGFFLRYLTFPFINFVLRGH